MNNILMMFMQKQAQQVDNNLCFTAVNANSTVKLTKTGSPTVSGLQYKVGNGNYLPYAIDTVITCSNVGDKVYFRNTENTLSSGQYNYVKFVTSGLFQVSGELNTMINGNTEVPGWTFFSLFQGTNIYSFQNMSMSFDIIKGERAFNNAFSNNSNLIYAPKKLFNDVAILSNSTYAFQDCFNNCQNMLTTPQTLNASSLGIYCFATMFKQCKALTTIPSGLLPSTTLAISCYQQMFYQCTGLTTIPSGLLPATSLASSCYKQMFYGCTKLTNIPNINHITSFGGSSCQDMFNKCSNISNEITFYSGAHISSQSFRSMFANCTSIKRISAMNFVLSSGFMSMAGMFQWCGNIEYCPSIYLSGNGGQQLCAYMFENNTKWQTAPSLTCTGTLGDRSFAGVFKGNTNLTSNPTISFGGLGAYSLKQLFCNCSNLNSINVNFTSWGNNANDSFLDWVKGVANSGTFTAPTTLPLQIGDNRMPTDWTYPNHQNIIVANDISQIVTTNTPFSIEVEYILFPPNTVVMSSNNLPSGLSISGNIISGTLTADGTYIFNVDLTCSEIQQTKQITVNIEAGNFMFTPHNLSANDSDSRYTVSQVSNQDNTRLAFRAMDGSIDQDNGCSHTSQGSGRWWQIQFNEGAACVDYLKWQNRDRSGFITNLKLQGSNDGVNFTDIQSFTIDETVSKIFEFNITNSNYYTYYRIAGNSSGYLVIGQIEFRYKLQTT